MALVIFSFSFPEVGRIHTFTVLPNTTMVTVSISLRLFTISLNDDFNKGSRLGISIEPEMSIRKTRLLGGMVSRFTFLAHNFKKTNCFSVFHGQPVSAESK